MSQAPHSKDPNSHDTRRFRLVLVLSLVLYAAVGVALTVLKAPPREDLQEAERQRVARLLIDAEELARQQAEAAAKKAAEEAERRKREEEEARKKAEEEARQKAEEEARKKAEEEARKKAEEEARKKAEEEARKRAEEEAKKRAEEEAAKRAEEERLKAMDEEARKAEEARRKAEEERRRAEAARKAEEERQRAIEEETRRKAEAERQRIAAEEARQQAAAEEARRQQELARLAAIKAALEEKRRREEAERLAREQALGAGLLGGLDDEEDDFDDFLAEDDDEPLMGGGEGTMLGAASSTPAAPTGGTPGGSAEVDQLLADIGELEDLNALLGDIGVDAASEEELTAFLEEVSAGRVDLSEMVARNVTRMESPFTIEREVGGFGVRKADDIRAVIRSHRGELRFFYEQSLTRIPGLRGTVVVRMVINAAGKVTEASVVESDTGAPAFDQELVNRIREWVFPPVTHGEVEGTYPFRFGDGI